MARRATCPPRLVPRRSIAVQEPLIYREEVKAVLIALSDIIVELREINEAPRNDGEEEEDDEG
jgi:hypothetical protein